MPQKMAATKMCMDAAVQKEMMDMGMGTMKSMCTKNDIRREGNKVYGSAECKFGDATMKSSSVTTFTGDTAYHTEVKSTYDPPMQGMPSASAVIDAKWTGACPAGMQAADVWRPAARRCRAGPPPAPVTTPRGQGRPPAECRPATSCCPTDARSTCARWRPAHRAHQAPRARNRTPEPPPSRHFRRF